MLVSLHLPKTAGTSFGMALERHFRAGLQRDYDDRPLNTPVAERNASALQACLTNAEAPLQTACCVHGHFLPVKYLLQAQLTHARFITWMRHPVDRLVSHYFFWKRHAPDSPRDALHCRMHDEDWSLEKFCLLPDLQDVYTQFLWAFPLEYFDFVGITEYFEEDFAQFSQVYLEGGGIGTGKNERGGSVKQRSLHDRSGVEATHRALPCARYGAVSARSRHACITPETPRVRTGICGVTPSCNSDQPEAEDSATLRPDEGRSP